MAITYRASTLLKRYYISTVNSQVWVNQWSYFGYCGPLNASLLPEGPIFIPVILANMSKWKITQISWTWTMGCEKLFGRYEQIKCKFLSKVEPNYLDFNKSLCEMVPWMTYEMLFMVFLFIKNIICKPNTISLLLSCHYLMGTSENFQSESANLKAFYIGLKRPQKDQICIGKT